MCTIISSSLSESESEELELSALAGVFCASVFMTTSSSSEESESELEDEEESRCGLARLWTAGAAVSRPRHLKSLSLNSKRKSRQLGPWEPLQPLVRQAQGFASSSSESESESEELRSRGVSCGLGAETGLSLIVVTAAFLSLSSSLSLSLLLLLLEESAAAGFFTTGAALMVATFLAAVSVSSYESESSWKSPSWKSRPPPGAGSLGFCRLVRLKDLLRLPEALATEPALSFASFISFFAVDERPASAGTCRQEGTGRRRQT